jgi:type IV pilus assembly protein PilN
MIRINLLAVERERKKARGTFQAGQKIAVGGSLILVLGVLLIGWRYWAVTNDSKRVDDQIAAAQKETARLHTIIQQVQQYEQQKAQLQQRVSLIEELRKGQSGPVHMLDQISRALPPMLWLTELKQTSATEITIDGRCTNLTSVSDFVANLEASGYFKRSIDIFNTTAEAIPQPPGEVTKFTIKAQFQTPPAATASLPAKRGG